MKKLFSILLALVMMMSLMSVTAFATELKINEPTGMENATYAGYMILNATNNADNHELFAYTLNETYANILKTATDKTTEKDIVNYITALKNNADGMRTFANDVYAAIKAANIAADATLKTGSNSVGEGYWLIAQTSDAKDSETQSLVMVDTAGKDSLTIESKKSGVTVDKTVTDESQLICENTNANHEHTAACYNWTKANECPIGSTVQFKIETAVPSNMSGYKYGAYFIVGDTLSDGLTLNKNSVIVTIGGKAATANDYTVRFAPACADGYTFQVALKDAKACAGKDIVITYSAVLNKDAKLALTGNPNEADVTYSNKPNEETGGKPGTDGFPQEENYTPDGKTPKAYTITYGTGLKFIKVDGNTKALSGAEFTITGTTESTVLKWEQKYTKVAEGETGTYYLLKNGSYTKQAPITADKMEKASAGATAGYVIDSGYTGNDKVVIGDTTYRPYKADDTGIIYVLVKANTAKYAETTANYTYSEGWETQESTKSYNTKVMVDDGGIAYLPGLAAGTYTVTESKVPEGYNKVDDFVVVITWTAPTADELAAKGENAQCSWTAQVGNETLRLENVNDLWSLFDLQVVNQAGAELPSTGGVGTTVFYILGSVLLLGASVLLITKKRMSAEE